jgi:DNA-binding beta-propeller fold protein YncE
MASAQSGGEATLQHGELMALFARQELAPNTLAFLFGAAAAAPALRTARLRDLVALHWTWALDGGDEAARFFAERGLTPEAFLERSAKGERELQAFLKALEQAVMEALDGVSDAEVARGAAALLDLPDYAGAVRVALTVDVLGEKVSARAGPQYHPYEVRLRVVASSRFARDEGAAVAVRGAQGHLAEVVCPRGWEFQDADGRRFRHVASPAGFAGWLQVRGGVYVPAQLEPRLRGLLARAPHAAKPAHAHAHASAPAAPQAAAAASPQPLPLPSLRGVAPGCSLELVRSTEAHKLSAPEGLAVNARGELLVAELGRNRVVVLSDGAVLRELPCGENPRSVAVDAAGRVVVALHAPKRVVVASPPQQQGAACEWRDVGPLADGELGGGVCALRDGSVAVSNFGVGSVSVFPPPLTFRVPSPHVWDVSEAPSGELLVTASAGGAVWRFARDGRLLDTLAGPAGRADCGEACRAVASAEGAVVVADRGGRLHLLAPDGRLVCSHRVEAQLMGLALLPDGTIAASSRNTGQVLFFRVRPPEDAAA